MLVQPRRQPVSLLLRPPEIPGSPEQLLPSGERPVNRSAALDNFPEHGLKVYVPAWSAMGKADKVELLFKGLVVDQHTLTQDTEVGERVTLWVAPKHWLTGSHTLAYRVTRFNQGPETYAPPLKLYAKLEIPAGQDTDEEEGSHSNLYLVIDPPIHDSIVDKDIAEVGVRIIIRAESGTGAPYPDAAVGDVIVLSWGGVYVESAPLTAEQISDPVTHPIVIHIDQATILKAGDTDGDGLAVTFRVRDVVHNYSEDWCKATRLVVMTGIDLLDAPIAKEAVNNILDLDALGEKNLTVQVWAKKPAFQLGDSIVLTMRGTTVDNETVEVTTDPLPVGNLPHTYEVTLSNANALKLAKTQVIFSYLVKRPGVADPLPSKGQFVTFIGEPKRLAAPSAEDEQNGAIDPDLPFPRVRIPFDPSMLVGMAIELIWFGTRPDTSSYTPELDWYFLSKEEIEAGKDIFITVDGKHLNPLEGGTLILSYNLLSEGQNGEILRRESLHAALLQVGEPQFELVKPIVLGEQDGALEPGDLPNGVSKLTAPNPTVRPTQAGDKVTYTMTGEESGEVKDSIVITRISEGKDVHFTLNAQFVSDHFEANRGKKVTVSYRIWWAATGETSYSNGLEFVVGTALELKPPRVAEADDKILDPVNAKDMLTIQVPTNADHLPDDRVSVHWAGAEGTPPEGSFTSPPTPVSAGLDIRIPNSVVAYSLGLSVRVFYTIRRGTSGPQPSQTLLLSVLTLSGLEEPLILEADNEGAGPDFIISGLTAATVRCKAWPLIALYQPVWLHLRSKNASGGDHNTTLLAYPRNAVHQDWLNRGYHDALIPSAYLQELDDGKTLEVEFKAALDKGTDESKAVKFPVQVYTVKALVDLKPEITSLTGSPSGIEIPDGDTTVETSVTLTGTASKGQKVDVLDGAVSEGQATADPVTGIWTLLVTALSLAAHSFTAKALYGLGQSSAARTLTVTAVVAPTISSVKGSPSGIEIPDGDTTVETSVTLTGTASKGQKVDVLDGAVSKGQATADPVTGIWTLLVAALSVAAHSFTAKALYGPGQSSAARTLTVTAVDAPTISSVKGSPSGIEIPDGDTTVETSVTLTGTASKGQKVDVLDGAVSKGQATADPVTGIWTLLVAALSVAAHSFTAKALYGSGQVSGEWTLRIEKKLVIDDPSPLLIQGRNIIAGPRLNWTLSGKDLDGTTGRKSVSGGIPPYTYTSSHPGVASVDTNGKVRSLRNGAATITVTDSSKSSISFTVQCSNVYQVLLSATSVTGFSAAHSWILSAGGIRIDSSIDTYLISSKYKQPADAKAFYHRGHTGAPESVDRVVLLDPSVSMWFSGNFRGQNFTARIFYLKSY